MSGVTALRLSEDIERIIEERVKEEKLDKSTVMRQFLMMGISEYRKQKAIQLYREGKVSLSGARQIAGVTVFEMMELLIRAGIKSDYSVEDMKKERELLEKMFKSSVSS